MIPLPYADENDSSSDKTTVLLLIGLNILALAVSSELTLRELGFVPADPDWYRWLTSQFLHAGPAHLLGNMWCLWLFGDNVSARLGKAFLPFYLAGGVAANGLHMVLQPFSRVPCVGASGAICAVIGAYVVLFPRARMRCVFYTPGGRWRGSRGSHASAVYFSMSALLFGMLYLLWQFIGLLSPGSGVAYGAHVGGLIFGIGIGAALRGAKPEDRTLGISGPIGQGPRAEEKSAEVSSALSGGQEDYAVQTYVEAVRRDPYFQLEPNAQLAVADKLVSWGYPHLAKSALERLGRRNFSSPCAPYAYLLLGHLEQASFGDYDAAVKCFQQVLVHPETTAETKQDAQNRLAHAQALRARTFVEPAADGQEYCVIRETTSPLSEPRASRVAEITGANEKQLASGFLFTKASAAETARVAELLEKAGVPVVAVPTTALVALPPASLLDEIRVDPKGISLRSAQTGHMLPWNDCLLIAAFGLPLAQARPEEMGLLDFQVDGVRASRYGLPEPISQTRYRQTGEMLFCLEVVSNDPPRRYRWTAQQDLVNTPESVARFFSEVREVLLHAPDVPVNAGAQAAFEGQLPPECVFQTIDDVDRHMAWHVQLARLRLKRS